jgi:hypothetical protein
MEESMQKAIGALILGLLIGAAAGWGYMQTLLRPALERAAQADTARDEAAKATAKSEETIKALEGQLKDARDSAATLQSSGKAAIADLKGQLATAISGREAAEKAAADLKTQLADSVAAKEAAEKALAEAKKAAAPAPQQ